MPVFNDRPPRRDAPKPLDLLRTPMHGGFKAICLSDNVLGCSTHFWGGRTVPCEDPNCPACDAGSPTRWHGYIAAWNPTTNYKFIFEFTDTAADVFLQYRSANGTLRGCKFDAHRSKPVPNGRVLINTSAIDQTKFPLPDEPNLTAILLNIWKLPGKAFESRHAVEGAPTLDTVPEILDQMHGRLPTKGNHKCHAGAH
jgi:hypothetical protein